MTDKYLKGWQCLYASTLSMKENRILRPLVTFLIVHLSVPLVAKAGKNYVLFYLSICWSAVSRFKHCLKLLLVCGKLAVSAYYLKTSAVFPFRWRRVVFLPSTSARSWALTMLFVFCKLYWAYSIYSANVCKKPSGHWRIICNKDDVPMTLWLMFTLVLCSTIMFAFYSVSNPFCKSTFIDIFLPNSCFCQFLNCVSSSGISVGQKKECISILIMLLL